MFKDNLINKALRSTDFPIVIDRSRCMRMRFDRNSCPVCISNCHSGAITVGDEIVINEDKCSLCMVCISECPSDCLDIKGNDFFSILGRLRRAGHSVSSPVLGCNLQSGADAHERVPCLGALSEEHLIAISVFMDRQIQFNLTCCSGCPNLFVIDLLRERFADIRDASGIDISEKILLIVDKASLRFEEINYNRRDFFSAVKNMAFLGVSGLFDNSEDDAVHSYSQKSVPLKRDILNATLRAITGTDILGKILMEYAYTIKADSSCDVCFSCIGICPTGALKSGSRETGAGLLFNSSRCIGCGLCGDFCPHHSISMLKGHTAGSYFEYGLCNGVSCGADSEQSCNEYGVEKECCHG